MPRALGARVLRRGAGPGPSPLSCSARCGAGGVGGVACCRVLGRCALVSGPPAPLFSCWGVGGCGRVGCELHSGREHLRAAAVS